MPVGELPVVHGDQKSIWKMVHLLLPLIFAILDGAVNYFKSLQNTSALEPQTGRDCYNDMAQVMTASCSVLKEIFSWLVVFRHAVRAFYFVPTIVFSIRLKLENIKFKNAFT